MMRIMVARVCECGGSMARLRPKLEVAKAMDFKNSFWGCTPTGVFKCSKCGKLRKFRLNEDEPRTRDLV